MDETTMLVPLDPYPTERGFDVVLRGYDRAQVDRHLDYLDAMLAETTARVSALGDDLAKARAEVETSNASAPPWEALGRRVTEILTLAEQEAEEIRRKAHDDVATLEERVRTRESDVEAVCAERQRSAAAAAEQTLRAAHAEAEQSRATAQEEAARLLDDARQEAERVRREAADEAQTTRGAAHQEAEAMRRVAEEDVLRLARRRDTIRHELESLHTRLASVMTGGDGS